MKIDFHVHTSYSYDSIFGPKEMVKAALKKGLDCIAITDHNKIKGALEALEFAKDKPILIIPGIEIKSKDGDILALGIKENIPKGLPAKETIKKIKKLGGKVFIPHPFAFNCSFKKDLEGLIREIDGIETLNASIFGSGNKKAADFAEKYRLPKIAGSDAHSPWFLGKVYLEIEGKNLSLNEIFEKIKRGEGEIKGREANFFEKVGDHILRNIIKFFNFYVRRKKR